MQNIQKMTLGKIIILILVLLSLSLAWLSLVSAPTVSAQGIKSNLCEGADLSFTEGDGNSCTENKICTAKDKDDNCIKYEAESENKLNNLITVIINVLSVIVGIIAVIFVIIGGAKFITSGGDAAKVSSGKSTVLYAIVGLIIVALAQFIVRFVLSKT